MKRFTSLMLFLSSTFFAVSQGVAPSAAVQEAYTTEELAQKGSEEISYLNFLAENLCLVKENQEKTENLPVFNLMDKNGNPLDPQTQDFNPLMFPDLQPGTAHQYFRIGDTDRVIFVYSNDRLQVLYQRYLANQH